ncbi:Transcription initiation factor IIF subunit beta [Vitis vinifera]|uniref:Transcription initiation factor IIF subunit beta n=1 Tax=Vitis vinifera TaxID=29760 RepID=A0A438CPR8_VITVI|nr:Transcription initiation factor IIF subunit beta [Vitis vinifera]
MALWIFKLLPIIIHNLNYDQFTMELAGTESGNAPKCYSMDMSQDFIPMAVFSESSQGEYAYFLLFYCHEIELHEWKASIILCQLGSLLRYSANQSIFIAIFGTNTSFPLPILWDSSAPSKVGVFVLGGVWGVLTVDQQQRGRTAVEGKILNKFDMKPHNENIQNYGKLCRERTSKYMTKSRQIQVIDNDNGSHMRPMPGMVIASAVSVSMGMATSFFWDKKKMPTKGSDMKRTRRDRGEMEEILFKLFERQPNWTLRQLIQETDQPEVYAPQQFLKDLLKDLCVYNNKGTNQGTYELKPEYKRSGEESTPK